MKKRKKVARAYDLFCDFLTKIGNVYKDMYIIDHKYVIGGKESNEEALGDTICILEEKYKNAFLNLKLPKNLEFKNVKEFKAAIKDLVDDDAIFNEVINKLVAENKVSDEKMESLCYMIESDCPMSDIYSFLQLSEEEITKIRSELSIVNRDEILRTSILELTDKEILNSCRDLILKFEDEFSKPLSWENMGMNEELIKTIYQDKRIFNMKIPNKNSFITIAKQLFPLVTEKTIHTAFMNLEKSKYYEDLYILRIDFLFTHFRFQGLYYSVPTGIENN